MSECIDYNDLIRYLRVDISTCSTEDGLFMEKIEQHLQGCEKCHLLLIRYARQIRFNQIVIREEGLKMQEVTAGVYAQISDLVAGSFEDGPLFDKFQEWLQRMGRFARGKGQTVSFPALGLSRGFSIPAEDVQIFEMADDDDFLLFTLHRSMRVRFYVSAASTSSPPICLLIDSDSNTVISVLSLDDHAADELNQPVYTKEIGTLPNGNYRVYFCAMENAH